MNKKNYLWSMLTMIMVAILSVGFVSCGGDDDDSWKNDETELLSKLQGTWEFYGGKETVMGTTITIDKSTLDELKTTLSTELGNRVYFWDETLVIEGTRMNNVPFSLKNSQIILDGMDLMEGFTITVKSVSSTKLILHEAINIEGLNLVMDVEYHKETTEDDNGNDDNNEKGNTNDKEKTDYTATNSVKKAVLRMASNATISNEEGLVFYQDYHNRYCLFLYEGKILVKHEKRDGSGWTDYDKYASGIYECGLADIGKVTKIIDILSKDVEGRDGIHQDYQSYYYMLYSSVFEPNHGYIVMFTTENGEQKYMRIFAKDYSLDNNSWLETVTVEYQLY